MRATSSFDRTTDALLAFRGLTQLAPRGEVLRRADHPRLGLEEIGVQGQDRARGAVVASGRGANKRRPPRLRCLQKARGVARHLVHFQVQVCAGAQATEGRNLQRQVIWKGIE